ncbi:acyl-ACP--UDP-N-acetylglucosamine O-acyltransferase [Neobacillus mesonae]|nr:acyl-ACP--UDP-N-acetylglucosamine O-acyltransferase [Neobacillus mesonae]
MVHSTSLVHPAAMIHPTAYIGENVEIGPSSIIEENVKIGDGCKIGSSVVIGSHTTIGTNNHIFHGAVIGSLPQDMTYKGEETHLIIGNSNIIREYATISKGTLKGNGITRIGHNNFIMNYAHIAHDVVIGSHVTITNGVQIAGHVEIEDYVTFGGLAGVHQHCRIGCYSMIGLGCNVFQDIVPYSLASGTRAKIYGINLVGLKRNHMSNDDMKTIKQIHSLLFRKKLTLSQALDEINRLPHSIFKEHIVSFVNKSERGIARMR